MNASLMARTAYSSLSEPVKSASSVEYEAFAKITAAMKRATSSPERAQALANNRRLWNCLAADVADPRNGLPKELRAQIFYLAEFTDHQSRKVLRTGDGIDALIEVNTAIMGGLRQQASR